MPYTGRVGAFPASNGTGVVKLKLVRAPRAKAVKRAAGSISSTKRSRSRTTARRKKNAKVGTTLSYPKIDARNPIKVSREEKIGGAIAGYGSRAKLAAAGRSALAAGRTAVGAIPKAGLFGAVALAGALSYALATAVIKRNARTKEELRENAFQLGQAYRRMRMKLEEQQGRALTPAQQKQAAAVFQRELLKLGLSSHDLSKLNQSFFERPI